MRLVDLGEATYRARIDLDSEHSDQVISLLDDAERLVLSHIERTPESIEDQYGAVPAGIKLAVIAMMIHLHDKPEDSSLPPAVLSLLTPYRSVGVW